MYVQTFPVYVYTSTTPTHLLVFNSQGSVTSGCLSRLKDFSLNACQLPGDCTVIKSCENQISTKSNIDITQWFVSIHITLVLMFCCSPGYSTCSIVKKQPCNFQLPIVDCPVQSSSIGNSMMSREGSSTSVFICFCAFTLQPFLYGRCFSFFNSLACGNGVDTVNGDTNSLGTIPCLTLVTVILTGDSLYRSMYFIY